MDTLILALASITFLSTMLGGLAILRFKQSLPYFFSFSAGSLMSVALMELLPESLDIAKAVGMNFYFISASVVLSFFFYNLIERFFMSHHHEEHASHRHLLGPVGAGSLIIHSFLDGVAIGAAYQVKASLGIIVGIAVISHDFADGINTVVLMLKAGQKNRLTRFFLFLDALAPILGVLFVSFIHLSQGILAVLLAVFVGEFIYIGAASLLPETKKYSAVKTTIYMALGIAIIMAVSWFI
jgi:ZIP family zinc transporter